MSNADESPVVCAYCSLPIEAHQRPSVSLTKGKEAHLECYVKFREEKKKADS